MKVFLSVSYSSQVDNQGLVLPDYRSRLEEVIAVLERSGHTVFCAPREDGWKLNDLSAGEVLILDIKHLNDYEYFMAIFGNKISAGMQYEIGYAFVKNKKIFFINEEGQTLSYINNGMVETNNAALITYDSQDDLVSKLQRLIHS